MQQFYPEVKVESAVWLHEPLAPCELLPNGTPGILLVVWLDSKGNGRSTTYGVWLFGEPGRVRGYRLVTPDFKFYDVDPQAVGGPSCDCPDMTSRVRRGGCKHCAALRMVGELPPLAKEQSDEQQ